MRKKLSEMDDAELKAIYIMYRDGDDYYSFNEIKTEFERRDKNKLWGGNNKSKSTKPFVKWNKDGSMK